EHARDQEPPRPGGRQADPQGAGPRGPRGRGARAHGPERLGQVHARQRDHGPPDPRGDRGRDHLQRRGHHRGRPGRARPDGPLHGLPVPGRRPRRDDHEVPAHGAERAPRGPRRGADQPQGLPQDDRGRDGARQRPQAVQLALPQRGLLRRREEAPGDAPARAAEAEHRRPRRDRLGPRRRRAQRRRQRGQRRQGGDRHGRAHHHPLPADPPPDQARPRLDPLRGAHRAQRRSGAGRAGRGRGLRPPARDHRGI
ncbi:MAG: Iron-sulfur cluster assembly ATPase protein SufC, partial [uncultured Solirubrobacteraceae bacterium]